MKPTFRAHFRALLLAVLAGGLATAAAAEEVSVAVAANFSAPMQRIAAAFESDTGHKAQLSFGATGMLYAQIKNGAPFQVLLAADQQTPTKLVHEGAALAGSQFTYATGRLVLWSPKAGLVDDTGAVLKNAQLAHVSYCNPQLAPYGAAAVAAMKALGVFETLQPKLVQAQNIAQAYQFVASGNAQIGFIALSQVYRDGRIAQGSGWILPAALYTPLHQDAVLLVNGQGHAGATELLAYLKSDKARALMRSYGYDP